MKLSDHVGHRVEISGTPLEASKGEKTADEKGVSSGTGSGAHTHVEKAPSPEDKGISSGKGSGANPRDTGASQRGDQYAAAT